MNHVPVPALPVRGWTKLENRIKDIAQRYRSLGRSERADQLSALAKTIADGKRSTKLVTIPFPESQANDVLEVMALTGIGTNGSEPTAESISEPTSEPTPIKGK